MIRKSLFVFVGLFFLLFFACSTTTKAFAQKDTPQITETPTPPVASSSPKIKYDLAYPGILPDNPLYKIKVLRDKITKSLISDNYKKIDFYLLQADKGILATAMLLDKNNIPLAEQTALKAEHNMTIISRTISTFNQKPKDQLFENLKIASLKHQEVLNLMIARLPKTQQKIFITVLDFSKRNLESIEKKQKKDPKNWNDWNNWN